MFGKKTIKQGDAGVLTELYVTFVGNVTHADILMPDGTQLTKVPVKYWAL
jgi:hypothetical protein